MVDPTLSGGGVLVEVTAISNSSSSAGAVWPLMWTNKTTKQEDLDVSPEKLPQVPIKLDELLGFRMLADLDAKLVVTSAKIADRIDLFTKAFRAQPPPEIKSSRSEEDSCWWAQAETQWHQSVDHNLAAKIR